MKIKKFLGQSKVVLFIRIFIMNFVETIFLSKNLGASNLYNIQEKFEAFLTIKFHAIEKGLALPNPRIGFGEKKIDELITLTYEYYSKFQNKQFLIENLDILDKYFEFQKSRHYTNDKLFGRYSDLKKSLPISFFSECGVIALDKSTVLNFSAINFEEFSAFRYSVRDFSSKEIEISLIKKAIEISKKTPSACNRQPWHVYVYKGERKNQLLKWQGGNIGFTESINTAILITCDYNGYFIHEKYQPYVDGGLYAMTMMFAFHSLGVGTIPLTTSKKIKDLDFIYKNEEVPQNQVPIIIIGVGHLKEKFNVAISHRIPTFRYVKFIVD